MQPAINLQLDRSKLCVPLYLKHGSHRPSSTVDRSALTSAAVLSSDM